MNFQQMYKDFQISFLFFPPSPVGEFKSLTSIDYLAEFSQVLYFTVDFAAFVGIQSIVTCWWG